MGKVQAIYITGFMGAGKTSVGKALGEKLNLEVLDTDQYMEEQTGKTVRDIFEEHGEEGFRRQEADTLKRLPVKDVIITTGGGIIKKEENRNWMSDHGHIIFLHCEPEEIFNRLKHDQNRPLLDGDKQEKIVTLYKERMPLYLENSTKVDTTGKSISMIVDEIVDLVKR